MHAPNFTTRGFQNHQPYINYLHTFSMTSSGCVLVRFSFYSFADTFLFLQHVKLVTDGLCKNVLGGGRDFCLYREEICCAHSCFL